MPSTPFDAAHQKSLRALIGKVLPDARAQHIAEAVAAGYGYRTHKTFLAAIRAVEAGRRPAPAPDFDADRLIARLHGLGEDVGSQDQALRFLLGVMSDGPRSGPPAGHGAPDEALARQCLRAGLAFTQAGQWRDAGAVLGNAMGAAPASLKGQVAAALEMVAPHSEAAAANLAFALLSADGIPRDVGRARALLEPLVTSAEAELRGCVQNWLGHIASGKFGGRSKPAAALSHFEQAAMAGHGEAAFNAGLMHDEGTGVPPSEGRACDFYRRGAELGHAPSMTNLAAKVMRHDPREAMDLCERAAEAGDGKAAALLQALTETGMAIAVEGGLAPEGEGGMPPPVRVVPSGIGRPRAIASAFREGMQAPPKEAEEITAYMLGFGSWRELARAARKGKADPPDEECGAEEVRRRRTYQTHMLALCVDMGAAAAAIAVEALMPTAEATPPVLDPATLARMQAASYLHADAQGAEDLDEEEDHEFGPFDDDGDLSEALNMLTEMLGAGPKSDPMGLVDSLRHMQPIQPDVWLGMMEEHLGWAFSDVDEDAERDGDQVAVAIGGGQRRVPVFMSAVAYIPGDLQDEHVARLKAHIGAAHPAGAVLMFNKPVGWRPEQGPGGLLYGGLLWWDKAWSDFLLRPGGGLDDALAQRGRDLAHPDARTVAAFGFVGAAGLFHSLAAYLEGLEPDEADVRFLRSASGWLLPLVTPL